jgi:hypothetical protein
MLGMDFAIFAIAFNMGKMWNKTKNNPTKQKKSSLFAEKMCFLVFVIYVCFSKNQICKNLAASTTIAA